MACMITLKHLVKDEDIGLKVGVSYASCGLTSQWGGWKESGTKWCVFTFHYGSVPSCHAALFY